ncbi:MAG: hypothetical protein ACLQU1_41005 [Bryobacteraceae bacterium]
MDILVKPDAENAKRVYAALAKFGASLEGLNPAGFAEPGSFFRMGREPIAVDILSENLVEAWVVATRPVAENGIGMTPLTIAAQVEDD